jgi:hypothetical protein
VGVRAGSLPLAITSSHPPECPQLELDGVEGLGAATLVIRVGDDEATKGTDLENSEFRTREKDTAAIELVFGTLCDACGDNFAPCATLWACGSNDFRVG